MEELKRTDTATFRWVSHLNRYKHVSQKSTFACQLISENKTGTTAQAHTKARVQKEEKIQRDCVFAPLVQANSIGQKGHTGIYFYYLLFDLTI